ncbi:Txe/YoeB family addiction module toxin [Nitrosomonas sp. JL21]|uniref:Txe/YoeB family addiction module toxin n=1 Tax=Nitrosomonas sp. JL21 TaxID=153949 RepID=UPI001368E1A4|nr:Txe/YoeB family addiction module toxin [Nitrosomonas sp. JL21]
MNWEVLFTRQAQKDANKISQAGLKPKVVELLKLLEENPFQNPPPYEKLIGDLSGAYSRRITIQHRLIYQIYSEDKKIKVLRMWTHYE